MTTVTRRYTHIRYVPTKPTVLQICISAIVLAACIYGIPLEVYKSVGYFVSMANTKHIYESKWVPKQSNLLWGQAPSYLMRLAVHWVGLNPAKTQDNGTNGFQLL